MVSDNLCGLLFAAKRGGVCFIGDAESDGRLTLLHDEACALRDWLNAQYPKEEVG